MPKKSLWLSATLAIAAAMISTLRAGLALAASASEKYGMQHLCETELKACPNMEIRLVQGDAASEILKAVQTEKADLVVITTHGLSHDKMEKKSPLFGSVAEKVIRTSPVPVHLVNPFGE